jgi:hypothetical protein
MTILTSEQIDKIDQFFKDEGWESVTIGNLLATCRTLLKRNDELSARVGELGDALSYYANCMDSGGTARKALETSNQEALNRLKAKHYRECANLVNDGGIGGFLLVKFIEEKADEIEKGKT